MLSYNIDNYTFNFYDINTEMELIKNNGIPELFPINSLAPGFCAMPMQRGKYFTFSCFYNFKQKPTHITVASNIKQSNMETVIRHVIDNYNKFLTDKIDWNNDTTQLSVLKYSAIDNGIMFYIETATLFESAKQEVPFAYCSHYSDPSINFYSSKYQYANKTNTPNCSNETMTSHSHGSPVPCMYSSHSACPLYQKNQTQLRVDYFYNSLITTKPNKYELLKTYFSNSKIEYNINVDDVLFATFTYDLNQPESVLDESAISEYQQIINTTSNLENVENLNTVTQTQNESYISKFISKEETICS